MPNVKTGDMAIIVSGGVEGGTLLNMGKIVMVGEYIAKGSGFDLVKQKRLTMPNHGWWCTSDGTPLEYSTQRGVDAEAVIPISDKYLRPVSGLPEHNSITDKLKEKA